MANPSLQIGNGKFAIKENDLLGYSSSGTKFFPIPITMTRATLGTRVNPSGLVEDVALLGSELVDNGSFTTDSDWNKLNGSTISGGVGNVIANGDIGITGANWSLSQDVGMILGKTYKISFSARQTGGTGNLQVGQAFLKGFNQSITSSFADYSFYITALNYSGNTGKISIGGNINGDTFEVDNVSVKEATIDGLARVDYTDGTGSLLVEPERTNLLTYSEDFSNATWTKLSGGTGSLPVITPNNVISPDGTTNADKIVFDAGSGTTSGDQSQITDSVSFPNNTTGTASIYLKGENGGEQLVFRGVADGTYTLITLTTDWQRFSTTENSGTNTDAITFGIRQSVSGLGVINSSATVYAWGSQIEQGSYATSYIKTQGLFVTRNADLYTKTGISDKINSEEGVLFVEMAALADDSTRRAITLSDGTTTNRLVLRYKDSSNTIESFIVVANNLYGLISENSYTITNFLKIAYKWKAADFALWINGVEVATSADATSFGAGVLTQMQFNDGDGAGNEYFGKVKQLQVYKTADIDLATLTTI